MKRKFPRSNEGAARIWAESILSNERCTHDGYNSVRIYGNMICSFGSHFPMGIIVRDSTGRVRRVIVNNDRYPDRGFASTPSDLGHVHAAAREAVSRASRHIPLERRQLTNFAGSCSVQPMVRTKPRDGDPEPPAHASIEIPLYFHATDPGPEPEKTTTASGYVTWSREGYAWHAAMHGRRGYATYLKMMERFGAESEWREARREDVRRVREARKAHAEWVTRNTMSWHFVSVMHYAGVQIPNLDANGYPLRKDEYAYQRWQRAAERQVRQARRSAMKRAAERRQLERFTASIRRRRRPSFESVAAETAQNLADLRMGLSTNDREGS